MPVYTTEFNAPGNVIRCHKSIAVRNVFHLNCEFVQSVHIISEVITKKRDKKKE